MEAFAVFFPTIALFAIAALFNPEHGLLMLRIVFLFTVAIQKISHYFDFRGKSVRVLLQNLIFHFIYLIFVALLVAAAAGAFTVNAA
jgi:hypothetical protein